MFPNTSGDNRSNVSGTWAQNASFHINFPRSRSACMSKEHESGWLGLFEMFTFVPRPENDKDFS